MSAMADDWRGMYHIAATRALDAEAEVTRLRTLTPALPENLPNADVYQRNTALYTRAELESAFVAAALHRDMLALEASMLRSMAKGRA